jgi:phospholipid/cholesterol/gamma-HCH transport system ATP-binding protein
METPPLLQLVGVAKTFDHKQVLRAVDLSIAPGETVAVLGPSGSGKSVLLRLIMGLCRPDAGRILFGGQDIASLPEGALQALRARMSMLFQGGALFDSLTVAENVAYPLRVRGASGDAAIAARVADCLAMVGLPDTARMMPAELSGGMKKRVALARAIAGEPELILYDEPTTGLDPMSARRINDLIRSIQQRMRVTSIVVTHDVPSALRVADRIAILSDGRIRVVVTADVFVSSSLPEVRAFSQGVAAP